MNEQKYKELIYVLDEYYEKEAIIIEWQNGLRLSGKSFTGMYETDTEPEDEDYIGEYAVAINEIEIIQKGRDDSIDSYIHNNSIEISLKNIPSKIESEDGAVLWENNR